MAAIFKEKDILSWKIIGTFKEEIEINEKEI